MPKREAITFTIEDAVLTYQNFEGRPTKYNQAGGTKSFSIILTPEQAKQMKADGWNVRFPDDKKNKRVKEEWEDEDDITIQVEVGYKKNPPKVVLFTSKSKMRLGKRGIYILDSIDMGKVDVTCTAGYWRNDAGEVKIKAWLKTLVVFAKADYLTDKYNLDDIPIEEDSDEADDERE